MAKSDILVHLNMNGNEIQNVVAQNLAAVPESFVIPGRFYFNTIDDTLYVRKSTGWANALGQGSTYSEGDGIDITNDTISIKLATGTNVGNVTLTTTNGLSASVAEASTTTKGIIEIATDSEATTGTSEVLAINPKQLAMTVSGLIKLNNLSISSSSTNYLGYDNTTGQFSAKVDTIVGTISTNLVTSGAVNTALGNKLNKKPDGTNDLIDSGNKVAMTYLPDVVLGQMLYAGTFAPSTAVATLSDNAKIKLGTTSNTIILTNNTTAITGYKANEGNYYLCSADGTFAGISFLTGDWLLSTGSGWTKIDNTDAVTGIKGNAESSYRIGNVNITADNIMPTQTGNNGKYLTTNGTTVSWGTVDALPSQDGQSGKFLTTNGTVASWAEALTASSTNTLTNKTIDANGTGNSISNLETEDFASGVIQTTIRGTSSASDTALISEKALVGELAKATSLHIYNVPALTSEGGECTYTKTITLYSVCDAKLRTYPDNKLVMADISFSTNNRQITVKINSTTDIAANTYRLWVTETKSYSQEIIS